MGPTKNYIDPTKFLPHFRKVEQIRMDDGNLKLVPVAEYVKLVYSHTS